jgi:hypothetical protein
MYIRLRVNCAETGGFETLPYPKNGLFVGEGL